MALLRVLAEGDDMALEIERKFLVKNDDWRKDADPVHTAQGYLCSGEECTVRVRIMGEKGFLTVKGKTEGVTRSEYEYETPTDDAQEILARLAQHPYIEKNRYKVKYAGLEWEIDEFLKDNQGLVVAEVELASEKQRIELPPWVGKEVSDDPKYLNVNLMKQPYSRWRTDEKVR
jgi:adenylate cyclase